MYQCIYSSLAQSVEHAAVNRSVVGSSPTGGASNSVNRIVYGVFVLYGNLRLSVVCALGG